MSARRKAATLAALGIPSLALTALAAAPASAHGSLGDPVSRVFQCYGEGPESPKSAACRAAVAAGGTQALYDWNGVRIGDAGGRHQELIPDGRLCSANNEAFKGLDLPRADWPATSVRSGSYTFKYRVTAPHKGSFQVYITKPGYDPAKPLAWSDLDLERPVATATDPAASGGFYTFSGTLPERSGKHVLYTVWQRSDSPEAFYSCSDVTFGGGSGGASGGSAPAPAASAPTEQQIKAGAGKSSIENHGQGDADPHTTTDPTPAPAGDEAEGTDGRKAEDAEGKDTTGDTDGQPAAAPAAGAGEPNRPKAAGTPVNLAETGGDSSTPYLAIGGAAALALGSAALFASVRRRAAAGGRRGR
ncbi:chitin-binding protein [Streptomyces sp. F-3]|jgi:chitin-binding protein|uniref:Carbohydrate-binding protein CbpC n=1 Tax=Streptomyces thermogriseus TaxID=75292 RepID=A0ABN1SZD8_9ACTN|nr:MULTISPECIES: lytic polysaccharide monooxygenase [Streptomyces]MDN5382962.1 lytic polysaccharide monooxygenase [Streptomyces sp. LB8]GAT84054.1 chitin-binding protein [Streptomyces sp. F-3]